VIVILLILYPKCSTCIKAKKYLEENNIIFELRDIVMDTPSVEELKKYISLSGKDIRKFFNTSGLKYRELGLKDKLNFMSDDEMINLLASDGMLIKRPLLVLNDNVLIGFREKEWSEII
jgi:arsenate reductase